MSAESRAFDALKQQILLSINTFMPCRVLSYNSCAKTCEVEPLFMNMDRFGNVDKQPPIIEVPVLSHVGTLIKNDMVFVAFAQRALDNLQNKPFNPESTRMFHLTDAVVIGKWEGTL